MSELTPPPDTAELEAREQARSERRLFYRQIAVVVLIAAIVAGRLIVV